MKLNWLEDAELVNLVIFCQESKNVLETCWELSKGRKNALNARNITKTGRQNKENKPVVMDELHPRANDHQIIDHYKSLDTLESVPSKTKDRIEHLSELSPIEFLSPHVFSCLLMSSRVFSCLLMSSRVFSCLLMSSHVFSCLLMSSHVFCHLLSSHVLSCLLMSSRVFSCLLVSSRVFSCLLMSSHVFSCLLVSSVF